MRKTIGKIEFKDKEYNLVFFKYFSGRDGVLMVENGNKSNSFNATLDIYGIGIKDGTIIVKNHDFNNGLLDVLIENKIISKQVHPITFGFTKVYICKLNKL